MRRSSLWLAVAGSALLVVSCGPVMPVDDAGQPCTDACTAGTARCANGGVERCAKPQGSCAAWQPRAACAAGETCPNGGTGCEPVGGMGGGAGGGGGGMTGTGGGSVGGGTGTGGGVQTNCVQGGEYTNGCTPCCSPFVRSFLGYCVDPSCRVELAPCNDDLDCCSGQCVVGSCSKTTGKACGTGMTGINSCVDHFYCQQSTRVCFTSPTVGETCNPSFVAGRDQVGPCDTGLTCVQGGDAGSQFGICACPLADGGTPDAGQFDGGGIPSDGGTPDGGPSDAGPNDAGPTDGGGVFDAGDMDAGFQDGGPSDSGTPDAGETDAGSPDAGGSDGGGIVDAG